MAIQGLSGKTYSSKTISRWVRAILIAGCAVGLLAICLALKGCAPHVTSYTQVGTTWCRHNAILAAAICGEYYPVKIVVGKTPGGGHAQARCKIEGTWEWLQVRNGEVFIGQEEGPFISERRDLSIESYMQLMDVSYPMKQEGQ